MSTKKFCRAVRSRASAAVAIDDGRIKNPFLPQRAQRAQRSFVVL
jgi:hypothetical protein